MILEPPALPDTPDTLPEVSAIKLLTFDEHIGLTGFTLKVEFGTDDDRIIFTLGEESGSITPLINGREVIEYAAPPVENDIVDWCMQIQDALAATLYRRGLGALHLHAHALGIGVWHSAATGAKPVRQVPPSLPEASGGKEVTALKIKTFSKDGATRFTLKVEFGDVVLQFTPAEPWSPMDANLTYIKARSDESLPNPKSPEWSGAVDWGRSVQRTLDGWLSHEGLHGLQFFAQSVGITVWAKP